MRRKWLAHLATSLIFVWVVISGMFPAGTPVLDVIIGFGIIRIWTGVILHAGLLATVVALAAHFILLRAPITLEFSSWRGTPGLTYLLVVGGVGLWARPTWPDCSDPTRRERLSFLTWHRAYAQFCTVRAERPSSGSIRSRMVS